MLTLHVYPTFKTLHIQSFESRVVNSILTYYVTPTPPNEAYFSELKIMFDMIVVVVYRPANSLEFLPGSLERALTNKQSQIYTKADLATEGIGLNNGEGIMFLY